MAPEPETRLRPGVECGLCGASNPPAARYCARCGRPSGVAAAAPRRSHVGALAVSVFLFCVPGLIDGVCGFRIPLALLIFLGLILFVVWQMHVLERA